MKAGSASPVRMRGEVRRAPRRRVKTRPISKRRTDFAPPRRLRSSAASRPGMQRGTQHRLIFDRADCGWRRNSAPATAMRGSLGNEGEGASLEKALAGKAAPEFQMEVVQRVRRGWQGRGGCGPTPGIFSMPKARVISSIKSASRVRSWRKEGMQPVASRRLFAKSESGEDGIDAGFGHLDAEKGGATSRAAAERRASASGSWPAVSISGSAMPPASLRINSVARSDAARTAGGIDSALEAVAGIAGEAEPARGAADGLGIEEGALEEDIDSGIRDAAVFAAHDPGNGRGGAGIGDDEIGRRRAGRFFPSSAWKALPLGRGADVDFAFGEARLVKGMERLADFHHHVVGDIDDVVDRADADGFEPVRAASRGWRQLYAADAAGGVERAELRCMDA